MPCTTVRFGRRRLAAPRHADGLPHQEGIHCQHSHAGEEPKHTVAVLPQLHADGGSGFGKVSFYDLKAGKFLEWGNKGSTRQMLEMGKGWVCPNTIFRYASQPCPFLPLPSLLTCSLHNLPLHSLSLEEVENG